LVKFGNALIIDCHSYPDVPFVRDLDQNPERPDFNIGTDAFHTPEDLAAVSVQFFKDRGYSLGIDHPYSGAIVPMEHYQRTKEVRSIMLEINRKLYLETGSNVKSQTYLIIKKVVKEYLEILRVNGL